MEKVDALVSHGCDVIERRKHLEIKRFSDKVILVTGATSGIGRATAVAFAMEGATVVMAARRENLGAEVVDEIRGHGGEAVFIRRIYGNLKKSTICSRPL